MISQREIQIILGKYSKRPELLLQIQLRLKGISNPLRPLMLLQEMLPTPRQLKILKITSEQTEWTKLGVDSHIDNGLPELKYPDQATQ